MERVAAAKRRSCSGSDPFCGFGGGLIHLTVLLVVLVTIAAMFVVAVAVVVFMMTMTGVVDDK